MRASFGPPEPSPGLRPGIPVPDSVTRGITRLASGQAGDGGAARLGACGDQVMALVADGLTNDEIAGRLYPSPATVRTHVSRTMIKLGARDRTQLVVFAYGSGLVRPGWLTWRRGSRWRGAG